MIIMAENYEIIKEGEEEIMKIDANNWSFSPSLEDSAVCMAATIEKLVEAPNISRIMFNQRKNYSYDREQTEMLVEIANIYKMLVKQKWIYNALAYRQDAVKCVPNWNAHLQYAILNLLKSDPLGSYVFLKRILREEKISLKKIGLECIDSVQLYIDMLGYLVNLLDKTKLIQSVKDNLAGYAIGDRGLYSLLFKASISPDFVFTRLMARLPLDGKQSDIYSFNNCDVSIYEVKDDV